LCRRGKGKITDDPFVTPATNIKGKAKAKETDTANREVDIVKPRDGELEDEDDIVYDEPVPLSDWKGSGHDDDGKAFVYQEDLHKRR
jgi:hypothetical protein